MQPNLSGQTLGKYELRELLGEGGMGAVYRAYDHNLKREVAVKIINLAKNDTALRGRFIREAETAASLEHSHIVRIYDYGVERDINYIVMQNLTGGALSDRMKQASEEGRPRASLPEVALLLEQLASALDYAHAQGVIHRDIKPQNVMFNNQGQAFIVDFGIAKLLTGATNMTGTGMAMGTPSYMSPEQWTTDNIVPASDQYALAVMTYQLIAGRLPFEADTPMRVMYRHLNDQPTPLNTFRPDIPTELLLVMDRALAKDPEQRFPNCTQFAQAFASAVSGVRVDKTNYFTFKLARIRPSGVPYTPTPNQPSSTPATPASNLSLQSIPLTQQPKSGPSRNLLIGGLGALVVMGILAVLLLGNRGPSESDLRLTEVNSTLIAAGLATERIETREAGLELIATDTPELTNTAEQTATDTEAPSPIASNTDARTSTDTPTEAATIARSNTPTGTFTTSATPTPSATDTATATASLTPTDTATATYTPTQTFTVSPTPTLTATFTPSLSPREAALATLEIGATETATLWTLTPSATHTPTEDYEATVRAEITAIYLEELPVTPPIPSPTLITSTLATVQGNRPIAIFEGIVNIRTGPSTNFEPPLGAFESGQEAEILAQTPDGTWLKIRFNGGEGWVFTQITKIEGDLSLLPFDPGPPVPTDRPRTITPVSPTHTPSDDVLALAFTPVTRNIHWIRVERDFDGVTMMLVPAGCFEMGSNYSNDEMPAHEFCFDTPFWIDKTEVSQSQFHLLNGSKANGNEFSGDNYPVENITWFEAIAYCKQRGSRLPTEVEWEYAARGPNSFTYPWGNTFFALNAVYSGNSTNQTAMVGSKPSGASWIGALNLSGNVWEWTSSLYKPYPYNSTDGREADSGNEYDTQRVLRGGSWLNRYAVDLRAMNRMAADPNIANNSYGFRCARSI